MRDKCVEMSDNTNKMRDRLIELLVEAVKDGSESYSNIADYLLANGAVELLCNAKGAMPPCNVGDTVYRVDTLFDEIIITELTITELTIDSDGIKTLYGATNKGSVYCFDRGYNLNNIKFTKEEAERALKNGEPICDYTKTDWNDCCECSAKDYCDKYNERSEIIGELLGEIKNEGR